ncbi:MAG: sigma-70 family RNA polymerase sigma factor [Planctomycetota bacterium]
MVQSTGGADSRAPFMQVRFGDDIPSSIARTSRWILLMVGKPASTDGAAGDKPEVNPRQRVASATTERLLERYRLRGSRRVLDELVDRHRAVVESMARQQTARLPRTVDAQDLVHAGMWGLMQAISAYREERSDNFESFLRIRVRGAMLDELRHMDFLPRLFRRQLREREAARARLRMDLEREPTSSELAEALGITEDALMRGPDSALMRSVHSRDGDGDGQPFEQLADDAVESPIEAINRQELLERVKNRLEPIEWKVLELHYLDGLTGRQVAQRLRLSASRICQIHVQVLDRLKQDFTAETA